MALNLAPLRYRNILSADGGPIDLMAIGETRAPDGGRLFEAAARLRPELRGPKRELVLYDDFDGAGAHRSRTVAGYIAVSEALERWAFHASRAQAGRGALGFDYDDSTTGMAAFPGLRASAARGAAIEEAVERWAILEWWRRRLPSRLDPSSGPGAGALEVLTPFPRLRVLVAWRALPRSTGVAYGFAARPDRAQAVVHAQVELERNSRALLRGAGRVTSAPNHPVERRLIHFAGSAGWGRFWERAAASPALAGGIPARPRALVDAELPGPWARYARVWRVLYAHDDGPDDPEISDVFSF